ncbi:MAG: amidohydrolase family protein, partial [Chloroflexi bacterium]|nr:amidohydrolase family protein [Chloroflexota bacterium]
EDLKINFTSFFNGGTFEHFPSLKVVILESGIGWLAYWIDRMDEKFEVNGFTTPMKQKPNEYFQRQCWAVMDPDERLARFNIEALGADKFMWAYDYPHSDSVVEPVSKLKENLSPLPEEAQRKVFGENAIDLYKLG